MKLEEIKRHPYYPFSDFELNDLSFLLLELYWAELFATLLGVPTEGIILSKWVPSVPADRLDGNPILQVIDRSMVPPRQLRIIQKFNSTNAPAFDLLTLARLEYVGNAYVAFSPSLTYEGLDDDGVTPIEELVIFSDISEACERLLRQFVVMWCINSIAVPSMHQMVAQYWKLVQAKLTEIPTDTQ